MGRKDVTEYRFPIVRPNLPAPKAWSRLLEEVYASRQFSNFGPLASRLERALRAAFGAEEGACVLTCNATAGLAACLVSQAIDGAVLVPAFTFPASASAVLMAGAKPLVMDVDRDNWIVSPSVLAETLGVTKAPAVMLVAPFGISQDFHEHIEVCRRHDALLVLDNAAGLGAPRQHVEKAPKVFEVFSMHATKPFAVGEGGIIFMNGMHEGNVREALNFALRSYDRPGGPRWGINGKMSEFHAAIGLAQMEIYELQGQARQLFIECYVDMLSEFAELVYPVDASRSLWQFFPVLLPSAAAATRLIARAAESGLEIRNYYRPSLSRWPGIECAHPCPVSEDLSERMCCLPVYSDASETERYEVLDIVQRAARVALKSQA
jgi:dTDP-4-amino-4,6-dideoxygalactose transaminase